MLFNPPCSSPSNALQLADMLPSLDLGMKSVGGKTGDRLYTIGDACRSNTFPDKKRRVRNPEGTPIKALEAKTRSNERSRQC